MMFVDEALGSMRSIQALTATFFAVVSVISFAEISKEIPVKRRSKRSNLIVFMAEEFNLQI
jgi:hypothetical protein